jgi:transcriptional regulator with XRE-family HTH domain
MIMEPMERDPKYIADQVKFLRKTLGLTQENLADAAGLTSRTIEKIESGGHRPEEQTLRSLARALGLDVNIFQNPSPEQEASEQPWLQLTPYEPQRISLPHSVSGMRFGLIPPPPKPMTRSSM